jgi:hypothetical protein
MVPHHITAEEHELRVADKLFRARVTLRQLTDSWLLPVGDGSQNKIKVRPGAATQLNLTISPDNIELARALVVTWW